MAETSTIHEGMQRWLNYVRDYHIDEWAYQRTQLVNDTQQAWNDALWDNWQVPEVENLSAHFTDLAVFTEQVTQMNALREAEDVGIPHGAHLSYYAYEADRDEEMRLEVGQDFADDADMGERWQDQLAEVEARLELLVEEADMQQHVDRTEGMSY